MNEIQSLKSHIKAIESGQIRIFEKHLADALIESDKRRIKELENDK